MRTFGLAILWFLIGLIVGWVGAVAVGVTWMEVTGFFDRDGGASMGLIFVIGPFFGVIVGAIAAGLSIRRSRSR